MAFYLSPCMATRECGIKQTKYPKKQVLALLIGSSNQSEVPQPLPRVLAVT